jgi:hypothetical protein
MSTSHYASPFRGPQPPPNTRRWTAAKLATIGTLLLVDLLACIGASNLTEAATFAGLVIVNLWAINYTR